MKSLSSFIGATVLFGLSAACYAQTTYSVFKVCEDQHVIRTSDGAEAGHIEYIVTDPAQGQIVSSIVSGGTLGERMIVVPYSSMRFGAERQVTLTEITRERLISAPVIERNQINVAVRFEPAVIERSFTHFGVHRDAVRTSATSRGEDREPRSEGVATPGSGNARDNTRPRSNGKPTATTGEPGASREENATDRDNGRPKGEAGREGKRTSAEALKDAGRPRSDAPRDAEHPKGGAETTRTPGEKSRDNVRPDSEAGKEPGRSPAGGVQPDKKPTSPPDAGRDGSRSKRDGAAEPGRAVGEDARDSSSATPGGVRRGKEAAEKTTESAEKTETKADKATAHEGPKTSGAKRDAATPSGSTPQKAIEKGTSAGEDTKAPAEKKPRRSTAEPDSKPKEDRPGQ